MEVVILIAFAIAFIIFVAVPFAIRIVTAYERGVVFRVGNLAGERGSGLRFLIPFVDRMVKIDLRVVTMDVPSQEVITRDNVTVKVDAVVYFRVIDPVAAVMKVADYLRSTSLIAQTTLRSILGQSQLDELLAEREKLNQILQKDIDEATDPWGIKVSMVEIKAVELPQSMQRAMAAQAEAERERRAKIVHAEGEYQASEKLAQAAAVLSAQPSALQLRYLGTLAEIATERTNTIIFPLPIDIIAPFLSRASASKGQEKTSS